MTEFEFTRRAKAIVEGYVLEHLDKSDEQPFFDVYIVWMCKTLKNNKAMLSTTLYDGMYYEVVYNGQKDEFYLDAYKKFENRCIPNDDCTCMPHKA